MMTFICLGGKQNQTLSFLRIIDTALNIYLFSPFSLFNLKLFGRKNKSMLTFFSDGYLFQHRTAKKLTKQSKKLGNIFYSTGS